MLGAMLSWSTLGYSDTLYKTNTLSGTFLTVNPAGGAIVSNAFAGRESLTAADIIAFNDFILGPRTYQVSSTNNANVSIRGLLLTNPGNPLSPVNTEPITLQNNANVNNAAQNQTLTIGAGGIDMSTSTQGLTFSNTGSGALSLAASAAQTWSVRDLRTLTVSQGVNFNTNGNAITINGGPTGAGNVDFLGNVTGGGALIIAGSQSGAGNIVRLAGNNGAAGLGATTVAGGSELQLDQSAAGQNKLSDTASLTLTRGNVNFQGTGGGTEVVGSVTLGAGLSNLTRTSGTGVLAMNVITPTAGGIINFGSASIATVDNLNINSILGGWAVVNNSDWAVNSTNAADGAVTALATYTNRTGAWGAAGVSAATNVNVTGNVTAVPTDTINSLRFSGAFSLTQSAGTTLTITSGGILKNSNTTTTISGGTITAGANDANPDSMYIWMNQSQMTISSVIANNGAPALSLTKAGGGTLQLEGVNTYTGTTTIAGGILNLGGNTLATNGATLGTGDIINHGLLQLRKTAAATTLQSTISNNISGTGGFTLPTGAGGTLSGINTFFGDTTVTIGTLRAGSTTGLSPNSLMKLNAASGGLNLNGFDSSVAGLSSAVNGTTVTLGGNTLTLTGNSPSIFLDTSNGTPQAFTGIITGGGNLIKNGAYTQNLTGTGALSYTGTTTVNAGVLQTNKVMSTSGLVLNGGNFISNIASSLPTTASVNIASAGGLWTINHGFDQSVASISGVNDGRITIVAGASNQTITVTDNGGVPTVFNGVIAMSAQNAVGVGNVVKEGTNAWVLGGANSYTGSTTINGGIIRIATANPVEVIPNRTALTLANTVGVAFDLNGNSETIGSLAGGGAAGGNVTLGAGTLTTGLNNGSTTFDGTITATSAAVGTLVKLGNGTMTLTGANSFATLNVLDGGITLNHAGANALTDATAVFLRRLGSTLTLQTNETIGSLTSGPGAAVVLGANTLVLGDATSSLAAGIISGTGGVTKVGAGALILAGTNTYSGPTTINGGTITLGVAGLRGDIISDASAVVMAVGTTLNIGPNVNTSARSFERIASLSATTAAPSPAPAVNLLNGSNSAVLVLGDASDTTFIGNILGNNGETAVMKVGAGTFTYQSVATDTFDGPFRVEAGTLRSLGNGLDAANFVILNNSSSSVFRVSASDTIANINGGGRSLGFAPTTMGGVTGAGGTAVSGGNAATSSMGGNLLIGGNGRISIDTGVVLTLGGANPNPNFGSRVFGGIIEGLGGLAKGNAYIQELWGANTYSGLTTVTAGTLRLGIYGAATGVGVLSTGGIGSLAAGTSLILNSGGTLDFNGATQTVTGIGAASTGGTIQLVNGALTLSNQTTQSTATVFTGNLGSSLTVNGAGNLTLTANSSAFVGTVNVGAGQTLTIGAGGGLGDTARVNLAGGSTLAMSASDTVGSLSGGGNVTIASTFGLTLSEARSGAISATGFSGAISGAGSLVLSSIGGLRISTNQAYTGGTTLSAGSSLYLDYSGVATSIIPNTGTLTLAGARMSLIGGVGATIDGVAGTALNAGSTFIGANTAGSITALVNLAAITRAVGGTLQVGGSTAATSTGNVAGILGGWAVIGAGAQATDWAVPNGAATAISALPAGSYTSNTWSAGNHTTVTASTSQSGTTNDLRFNAVGSNTVTLSAAGTITSGGILVTPTVGVGTVTITGAALAGSSGNELILHQYNPRGDLVLTDVGGTNTIITKAGQGRAIITNNIAGAGATFIGNGILQLGDGGTTGMVGTGAITNHGVLAVNRSNATTIPSSGATIISGTGELWQMGAGALTLNAANTYQGRTTVFSGATLTLTNIGGLGAGAGTQVKGANLTSVHGSGVLDVNIAGTVPEWINLDGGTLRVRSATATTFNAPLTVVGTGGGIDLGAGAVVHVQSGGVISLPGVPLNVTGAASGSTIAFTGPNVPTTTAGITATPNSFGGPVNIGANAHLMFGNSTATGNLGSGSFSVAAGGSLSINRTDSILYVPNAITGAGTFSLGSAGTAANTVGGIGTVIMTGANDYTGPVLVRRGLLQIGNDSYSGTANTTSVSSTIGVPGVAWSIGDNSAAANGGDATVRFNSLRDVVTMQGDIKLVPNTTGISAAGASAGRSAILIKNSIDTLDITGKLGAVNVLNTAGAAGAAPSGQTGRVDVNSGVLRVSGGLVSETLGAGTAFTGNIFVNGGYLEIAGTANNTFGSTTAGLLAGGAPVIHNSTGTTTINGVNQVSSNIGLLINKGTVIANYANVAPPTGITAGASAANQAVLTVSSVAGIRPGMIVTGTNLGSQTVIAIINSTNILLGSNIGGTAVASGAAITFGYAGGGGGGAFRDDGFVSVIPGATLRIDTAETVGMAGVARGANLVLNASFSTGSANLNGGGFNAGLVNGTGSFIKAGAGGTATNYSLFNSNNSFSGDLQINHSLVFLGSLANSGVNSSAGSGGTIRLGTGTDNSAIQTGIDYRGAATTSNRSIILEGTGASLQRTISANGAGELKLTGSVDKNVATDMTLFIRGQNTAQESDIGYSYAQAYAPGAPPAGYLAGLLNGINTISGNITQSGGGVLSLSKEDGGWWYLSGANTYTGNVSINGGQLYANTVSGAASSLGNMTAAKTINLNGGSLIYTGAGATSNALIRLTGTTGGGVIANLGTGALVFNSTAVMAAPGGDNKTFTLGRFDDTPGFVNEYAGGIIDNSSTNTTAVAKNGLSTWRVSGTNTNTNNWTINEGVLQIANGAAIENGRTVTVANTFGRGARLEVINSETIGAIAGSIGSTVDLGTAATLTVAAGSSTYSGVIGGLGGLTRTNNDGTARVTTLTNKNTYDGVTTITTNGSNFVGNRIDVLHLANGGQPSGIGDSSSAAANLVINTNSGSGGLRWAGFTNQSTDRLFTIGSGSNAAHLWADGVVIADFAPKIEFTNTGAIAFSGAANSAQTFALRGGTIAENLFAPQLNNNGLGATSLTKTEGSLWVLTNTNGYTGGTSITGGTLAITNGSALGTGTIAINGGGGTGLQIRGGAGGMTLSNNFTNATTDGGIHVTGGGINTVTGTVTLNGTNAGFRVSIDAGTTLNFTNQITGAGLGTNGSGLLKIGLGTLVMSGNNNYANSDGSAGSHVAVEGGTLRLDYSAQNNSKLYDLGTVFLGRTGGGTFTGLGADDNVAGQTNLVDRIGGRIALAGGSHIEIVGALTVSPGSNAIVRESGTGLFGVNVISRSAGGTLDIGSGGFVVTDNINGAGGILNSSGSYATVAKTDWATTTTAASTTGVTWTDATDTISIGSLPNGSLVEFSSSGIPAGLSSNRLYYVVNSTATDFQVALTSGGSAINLTNSGTTTTVDRPGFINPIIAANYNNGLGTDTYGLGFNTDVINFTPTVGAVTTNNLRFNQAGSNTLTLGGTLSLQSAGILVTPNSGDVIITGGAIRNNATTGGLEAAMIHQHSASALQIDSVIQNNSGAQGLTKSGTGMLYLNAVNTQTGTINLNEGNIQVGGTIAIPGTPTDARLGGNNGAVNVSQGTTLTFNTTNATTHDFGTIQGNGLIQTTAANTQTLLFNDDNGSFNGELIFNGGSVQIAGNNNALGSNRGRTTFNTGTALQINDSRSTGELITFAENTFVSTLAAATGAALTGKQTLNNTTVGGFTYDLAAGSALTVSGLIVANNGFTKIGDGRLTLSANNFTGVIDGFNAANTNPSLLGQVLINAGELFVGNARATGATGLGNETIIANGAALDVRNIGFNYGDDPSASREIFVVEGLGTSGAGALRSTVATATLSHLVLNNNTTISSTYRTNDFGSGRIDLNVFDTNINPGQTYSAPTLDGNGYNITKIGTGDLVFHDVNFTNIGAYSGSTGASGIGTLTVSEGKFRLETNSPFPYSNLSSSTLTAGQPVSPTSATAGAVTPAQIGSIIVNYAGPTQGNDGNGNIQAGAVNLALNLGARLEFFRQHNVVNTTPITLGNGYIDLRSDTIPKTYTYLDGTVTLTGATNGTNSIFNIQGGGFGGSTNNAIIATINPFGSNTGVNPGAVLLLTGNGGAGTSLTGTGGLTKIGDRELRILAPSNFTGDTIITRETATGLAIGEAGMTRAEMFSMTLAGNGTLGGTANVVLERSGVLRVDNTAFLNASDNGILGVNNNNRINDGANIRFRSGTLVFDNNTANAEVLGDLFVDQGRNYLGVNLTNGSGANTTLTLDSITRAAGSVLAITSWDSTSTFGSGTTGDSLRILLTDNGAALGSGLTGAATGATNKKVITGVVGGVAPLENYLLSVVSPTGDYPFRVTDVISQARNVILNSGRDLMTVDAGVLRPLDDSEYASTIIAGQNVNLTEIHSSMRTSTAINALRFGTLSDNQGNNGGGLIGGSQLLDVQDTTTTLTLEDNTVLQIASGMIVSSNFGVGTNQDMTTRIRGGTINFGTQEGVIINNNLFFRLGDGIFTGNNLEIGSALSGSGGLTKGGTQQVTLEGRNTFSGVTSVVDGNLFLRNSMALGVGGAGNGVTIAGSGNLLLLTGINVGSVLGNADINAAGPEDILVRSVATDGQAALRSNGQVNRYLGDLIIDNVDTAGLASHTEAFTGNLLNNRFRVRYVVDTNATLIHQGDIYGGPTLATNDLTITSSRYLSTDSSGSGQILLKGQFGDREVAGSPAAIANPVSLQPTDGTRTNVNEVLRFYVGNNDELNVNVYQPWDAVGRIELMRGFMRYLADPADVTSGGDFRTLDALSKIPVANNINQAGFQIGGSVIDNGPGDGSITAFLLTLAGQTMKQPNWTITGNGNNNNGSVIIGGENETGTVVFGDSSQSSTITLGRSLRIYANDGGTVEFDARLNGAVPLVKSGRGTVVLNGNNVGASSVNNLMLAGGTLVFDYQGANNARFASDSSINFAGGTILAIANGAASSTQSFGATDGNDINIRPGGTEIIARTTIGTVNASMTLNIGSFAVTGTGADLQRNGGGTVNFVEDQSAGGTAIARITLNTRTDPTYVYNTLIPWATYGTLSRTAIDFAMSDGGDGGDIRAFSRAPDEIQNNVALWSTIASGLDGPDLAENGGSGFFGTLAASTKVNSILFNAPADSSVQLGTNNLTLNGAAIMVASTAGAADKSIGGTGAILPTFVTARAATVSGNASITGLDSTSGFYVGMPISGTGIPADSFVVSVDSATAITINANATATGSPNLTIGSNELIIHHYGAGNLLINAPFGGPAVTATGGSSSLNSDTLNVSSTTGLALGMILTGTSIPAGATIVSIPNSTTVIISAAATAPQTGQTYVAVPQVSLTITGPSTTNAATLESTGAVVLNSTVGQWRGRVNINGSVLSLNNENQLGLADIPTALQDAVYLNGGTFRWTGGTASLDAERGFRFGGNGGVIDVTDGNSVLTINSGIDSENTNLFINSNATGNTSVGSGDLIKVGAGTLSLAGTSGNYQGMIDVREGTLRVATTSTGAAATIAMFGTNRSFIDGTIFRSGTNLDIHMSNGNASGEWAFDEWFRFDGNNTIRAGDPAASANARPIQFNGVIDLAAGNVTIDTSPQTTLRLNNSGGYLTGAGNITKIGQGTLEFRENNVEWSGSLTILEGIVRGLAQGRPFGVSTTAITLGSDNDQGIASLEMLPENVLPGTYYEVFQDINVIYNPLQTKRITVSSPQGADDLDTYFHGDIILNDNLGLLISDGSIPVGGKFTYANFNGDFKDGATTSGNLVLHVDETASSTVNERTNGLLKGYFVFNGDNTNWSGDITVGLNNAFDRDETTVLRLGTTTALTSKNDVTMNQNSALQVAGRDIAVGSLLVNAPNSVIADGVNGPNIVIENASNTNGKLTINQTTPFSTEVVWNATFQNGDVSSHFYLDATPGAGTLSLQKAGAGWATLVQDNHYTGTTTVSGGVLQVGRNGIGDTGAPSAAGTIVGAGAILAGTGIVQGGATVQNLATIAPGDQAGSIMGTLTFNGNLTLAVGSTTSLQVQRATYNNAGNLGYTDGGSYAGWISGIPTDLYSGALADPTSAAQHDAVNVLGALNWSNGTVISLLNNGYSPVAGDIFDLFDWFSVVGTINVGGSLRTGAEAGTDLNLFELGGDLRWDTSLFNTNGILAVVGPGGIVPEPSRMMLLLFGLLGICLRRRRANR